MLEYNGFESALILAAEDFPDENFRDMHVFSGYENKILRKLLAHGPILLRGGRGSGKSALLKEAYFRTLDSEYKSNILGFYISSRYLPLLQAEDEKYEEIFCKLVSRNINFTLEKNMEVSEGFLILEASDVNTLQNELINLSNKVEKRIILFFDDASHIGREISMKKFFDIFRTLSSNLISCKAAIYPGVTEFGTRFDLLNDTSVIDIARNEESHTFTAFFKDIIEKRYNKEINNESVSMEMGDFSRFLGRAVTGNVRAFIYALNFIVEDIDGSNGKIGLNELEKTLKHLASEYYWPLLDELTPKLGKYVVLIRPTKNLAEFLNEIVAEFTDRADYGPSFLVHRDIYEQYKKLFEILEYSGFIVKRDSSRAMKSGGRGTRYIVNLCNLIEVIPGNRLSSVLFKKWCKLEKEFVQINNKNLLSHIVIPEVPDEIQLDILKEDISVLAKSQAYPFGLTDNILDILKNAGIKSVGDLASKSDQELLGIGEIGDKRLKRIKSIVTQSIWM